MLTIDNIYSDHKKAPIKGAFYKRYLIKDRSCLYSLK